MDFSTIKAKSAARERGDWVDNIAEFGDIGLKVRGTNSATFRNTRDGMFRAVGKSERTAEGEIKIEVQQRIIRDAMAQVGIIDWRNMTYGGTEQPFDPKLAREFLDDQIFYDGVLEAMIRVDVMAVPPVPVATDATTADAAKSVTVEDGLGNSASPSSGN